MKRRTIVPFIVILSCGYVNCCYGGPYSYGWHGITDLSNVRPGWGFSELNNRGGLYGLDPDTRQGGLYHHERQYNNGPVYSNNRGRGEIDRAIVSGPNANKSEKVTTPQKMTPPIEQGGTWHNEYNPAGGVGYTKPQIDNGNGTHGSLVNSVTGELYVPSGAGYVGTQDGTYYAPAGPNGVIDTRTGQFIPHQFDDSLLWGSKSPN